MRIDQCGSVNKALILSWYWLFYHGGVRIGQCGSVNKALILLPVGYFMVRLEV